MANLSIGIVGLPNVGKSTLFKILTKQEITVANYPFATIDPNVGVVPVPDERLDKLAEISNSEKKVPAVVEFYDIAGLVKGANAGEGLGNQFLSHIRETDAVLQVVRCFPSDEIIHVEEGINPVRDIEIINTELIMKDLDTVEKRLGKLEGEARAGDKQKIKDLETLKHAKEELSAGKMLFTLGKEILDEEIVKGLTLLTAKKQFYLLNGDEEHISDELKDKIKELGADYVVINLSAAENIDEVIKKAYEILDLISFFTTGETESRAWTIEKGWKAPQAAGVIHTDFEKKFIRAEVVSFEKLVAASEEASLAPKGREAWSAAKQKGWLRLEGKDYVFQDGDVTEIRHG